MAEAVRIFLVLISSVPCPLLLRSQLTTETRPETPVNVSASSNGVSLVFRASFSEAFMAENRWRVNPERLVLTTNEQRESLRGLAGK